MSNVRIGWRVTFGIVCLLGVLGSPARAQWFQEDPNQCGPGELWYRIVFNSGGQFVEGQGWGYGTGWYYYPEAGVYRQWYYRGPYRPSGSASMTIAAGIEPVDPNKVAWIQMAFIWAAPAWADRGLNRPPLPADVPHASDEALYIVTSPMFALEPSWWGSAEPIKSCLISGYSPQWVGVEVKGANVKAMRWVAPVSPDEGVYDFGDAPDSYATTLAADGARHAVVQVLDANETPRTACLGRRVDTESDALPGAGADGDDNCVDADEDGVTFLQPLTPGGQTSIDVTATVAGYLNAWIDFDRDGTFTAEGDRIFTNQPLAEGVNHLTFTVPATAGTGITYARFRYTLAAGSATFTYKGAAPSGEVEDYRVGIGVPSDNFNDNVKGAQWTLNQKAPASVWLEEINGHLELRATSSAAGTTAQYVSNNWGIDPRADFTLKVNYHFAPKSTQRGWLAVRLSPAGSDSDANYVDLKVGCDGGMARFYADVTNARSSLEQDTLARSTSEGCLYVSYDADQDELYLSSVAWGEPNAWKTVAGLVKGRWGGKTLSVALGGTTYGLALTAGQAWLDDFAVENGPPTGPVTVYRFHAPTTGKYLYTIDEAEKSKLLGEPGVWTYEGPAYRAFATAGQPQTVPVYRFWSPVLEEHFLTIKESEKTKLLGMTDKWVYEDIAFYAYATPGRTGTVPLYRFWSPKLGAHFFTTKETEKNTMLALPDTWTYEDIAWYVYE